MIVSIYNDSGLNSATILEHPEEFKSAQEIIKKYIEEYKKDDGKARFVQINMGFGYNGYKDEIRLDSTISEYLVANKDKEQFFEELLGFYQSGSYAIYWEPDYQNGVFEGLDVKLNERNYYDDKSLSYVYNKSTKKWENELSKEPASTEPEVTNPITPDPSVPVNSDGEVIVIDPGHQTKANSEKEPIGPGASETKAKVSGGATGVATGKTEYQLNLEVSLKLKAALEQKGYTVIMTRTTNDVNLSNSERAQIANNANAAAFIRVHANSVDTSSVKGVLTMCQTANNPYNGNLAAKSYSLSKAVLDNFASETGAVNKGVTRTDTMSGINWCTVPTTIVEMGFMSNPEEDRLMATEDYQNKMVNGIVKGIEQFLNQ
ncbi:MAG: N-acetylmuramoyl-L-alanine amidase [Clostridia bacterium]|nr:N-acetylmuramoyl-L-alanine amidase [Clostridia bacterium]